MASVLHAWICTMSARHVHHHHHRHELPLANPAVLQPFPCLTQLCRRRAPLPNLHIALPLSLVSCSFYSPVSTLLYRTVVHLLLRRNHPPACDADLANGQRPEQPQPPPPPPMQPLLPCGPGRDRWRAVRGMRRCYSRYLQKFLRSAYLHRY